MKKTLMLLIVILILSGVLLVLAEEATQQAWRDFAVFIGLLESADNQIQNLYNTIISLESEKEAILGDQERKEELLKILDIHPDYNLNGIQSDYSKLIALKNYLIDNGYVTE